jgi:uncharacterized protein
MILVAPVADRSAVSPGTVAGGAFGGCEAVSSEGIEGRFYTAPPSVSSALSGVGDQHLNNVLEFLSVMTGAARFAAGIAGWLQFPNAGYSWETIMTTNVEVAKPAKVIAPPFTLETANQKVRMAEDAWNTRDPERVALAYTEDSVWRNRDTFVAGRDQIRQFLSGKWKRELDYRLAKALWAFSDNRIAVRFQYEWHDAAGQWFRSYGNELWEFDERGLMRRREASINDVRIEEQECRFHWPAPGPRPADHPGIPDVR